jgi:hypothetical protein
VELPLRIPSPDAASSGDDSRELTS